MELIDYGKMTNNLKELQEEADLLLESLRDDSSIDIVNDWCMMWRLFEKIISLQGIILKNWRVTILLFEIENPKDRFAVQKFGNECFNELYHEMDNLIKMGRIWKMEDYRCIDFVKRFVNCLVEFKRELEHK